MNRTAKPWKTLIQLKSLVYRALPWLGLLIRGQMYQNSHQSEWDSEDQIQLFKVFFIRHRCQLLMWLSMLLSRLPLVQPKNGVVLTQGCWFSCVMHVYIVSGLSTYQFTTENTRYEFHYLNQ